MSTGLRSHVGQELLKGEQMTNQPFDGQGLEVMLLVKDVEAVSPGIQLQAHPVSDQLARDVILLEIELDHAMGIDLALHMPAMQPIEPAVRIDDLGQGAQGRPLRGRFLGGASEQGRKDGARKKASRSFLIRYQV